MDFKLANQISKFGHNSVIEQNLVDLDNLFFLMHHIIARIYH